MASSSDQDMGPDDRQDEARRLGMRAGAAMPVDAQMARLVATIVFALANTGHSEAIYVVGIALRGCLGMNRAGTIWDAVTCLLDPDTEWTSEEVTTDGK